jgi:hypothetical protein
LIGRLAGAADTQRDEDDHRGEYSVRLDGRCCRLIFCLGQRVAVHEVGVEVFAQHTEDSIELFELLVEGRL